MYKAGDIAKYVIERRPVTNLQLQNLLYYIQKSNIKTYGIPMFIDDIYKWDIGPVVPNVYYEFCGFGANSILPFGDSTTILSQQAAELINKVIRLKAPLPVWDIVEEIQKDKPFKRAKLGEIIVFKRTKLGILMA